MVTFQEPIEFIVTTFYGTHVMNVADWKCAYCLFPRLTLDEKGMGLFGIKKRRELLAFDKYVGRGYGLLDIQQVLKNQVDNKFDELKAERRVGDAFSRRLAFPELELAMGEELSGEKRQLEEFRFRFQVRAGRTWNNGRLVRCWDPELDETGLAEVASEV